MSLIIFLRTKYDSTYLLLWTFVQINFSVPYALASIYSNSAEGGQGKKEYHYDNISLIMLFSKRNKTFH